jgi:hypothetical protein
MNPAAMPAQVLAWGPVATIVVIMTVGFVLLEGYRAWRLGERFVMPIREFIAVLVMACFLGAVLYTLTSGSEAEKTLDILLGALIGAASSIVAFYFSRGPAPPSDPPPPPKSETKENP